ncbi:MAG: DUF883 domain-containing protein [Betaproteobacteria bacterium HGW-Betaproteobacteria-10]|nr:MAG: DUF883 domain-containing protein [Betaproteobacteria bacterium HGW-Betaproteobacteria-10]
MTNALIARPDSIESSKQALENDLKAVVSDAGKLLNEVANTRVEEFAAARSRLEAKFNEARASLHAAQSTLNGKAKYAADCSQKYVSDNPWKSLGIIAAAGLIIGALIRR